MHKGFPISGCFSFHTLYLLHGNLYEMNLCNMLCLITDKITHIAGILRTHTCMDNRVGSAFATIQIKTGACSFITLQFSSQ